MNGYQYWFISRREWLAITREIESPNPFRYRSFSISIQKAKQLKPVTHFYADGYQPIIRHCLNNPNTCHGLTDTFDFLAKKYGAGHYLKSQDQQCKVLMNGLENQHIIILQESISYDAYEAIPPLPVKEKVEYLTTEELVVSHMTDPTNWIEFEIEGVANEPFVVFNHKTGQIIAQGQLDTSGHAYVDIPEQAIFLVDVVFHKTKEYRSWYYTPLEFPSQMLAGSMDALASSFDTINDIHLAEVIPIAKLYKIINLTKHFSPNSGGGSKIMPAQTKNGELIRSVSAFITEFYLLDLAGFSYIKPTSKFGQFSKGMASFGVIHTITHPVLERRVADLLSKDLGLKHAILDYLSVHPDDSNAEARFKNLLEGLALGALLEPLFIVFRIIKSTLTRTLIERIPTRRTYKLKAEKVEVDDISGGTGGTWKVIDEKLNSDVVKQTSPTGCGAACGEMLLKDRGIFIEQVELVSELTSMNSLSNKLNKVDSGWMGNNVSSSSFKALNQTGSWSAMMWEKGSKSGHWVVVKGKNNLGHILIYDPWIRTSYKMTQQEFMEVWNGHSIYKP